jgi:hypothetical protein
MGPGDATVSEERREFRRRAVAVGLSTVHISSPQKPGTMRVYVGGAHVRLRGDPLIGGCGGPRGEVRGFSDASRRRILQFLQTIDREKCG